MITEQQVNEYIEAMEDAHKKYYEKSFPKLPSPKFHAKWGKKFIKVIELTDEGKYRCVHCFIDMDGNLWKAASWSKPQPNGIRGHITKEKRPMLLGDFYVRF
jgi:hypothetical protein